MSVSVTVCECLYEYICESVVCVSFIHLRHHSMFGTGRLMKCPLAALLYVCKYGVYLRHKGSPLTRCYDTHLLLTRTKEAARCRLHAKQNKASERPSKGTQTCNKWRFNQANEQLLRHKTLFNFLQLKWFCSHDTQRGLSCPAER